MAHAPLTVYVSEKTKKAILELAKINQVSQGTIIATAINMFKSELSFNEKPK